LNAAAAVPAPDPALATIVLAAGEGRRFGGRKQLAEVEGEPMLRRAMDAVAGLAGAQVVVLGAGAEEIGAEPLFAGWEVEVAADWRLGQGASLRAGLRRAGEVEAAMVVLGDLPWLRREAAERVLAAARAESAATAFRAVDGATPGHPVLIRGELLVRARHAPDSGLGGILKGENVVAVPCDGLGVARDVDVPDDLPTSPSREETDEP
jgi:nicotine blue oxidoreductase